LLISRNTFKIGYYKCIYFIGIIVYITWLKWNIIAQLITNKIFMGIFELFEKLANCALHNRSVRNATVM